MQQDPRLSEISEALFEKEENPGPGEVTGLFVMAPIMCRFVLWVLAEAVLTGKKRLYFLARDGCSMYSMARTFCKEASLDIDCRYLYCSRYAWRSAEYSLLGKDSLSYICLGGIDVTFQKVMARAGLTEKEAREISVLLQMEEKWSTPLSYQEVKGLQPALAACQPFLHYLQCHAEEKYPLVRGYFSQEGLLEETTYAIVDSGWTGSMQKSLWHLLKSMGRETEPEGYYFGLYEYPKQVRPESYHAWYFVPEQDIRRKVYFSNSLFECIFSAPEGMTVGYEKRGKKYVPVLEQRYNPNKEKIEKSTMQLAAYAKLMARRYPASLFAPEPAFTDTAAALLYHFMGKPTPAEAQEFGGYVFCDDVIGEAAQKVAAPLSLKEVRQNRLLYKSVNMLLKKGKPVKESAWIEGSVTLFLKEGKKALRHCALYKYFLYFRKMIK